MIRDVDAIVIGSGQGGVPLAIALAQEGRSVMLFERAAFGGTCINAGCTPSKAFLAAAHSAGRARRAHALGLRGDVSVDFGFVMERVRGITASWSAGVCERLLGAGVEIVIAEASFSGERIVSGGGVTVRAPIIVIETGGTAAVPPIDGLVAAGYLDNTTFFAQRVLPRRFGVLGGGYIGLELGQGMARCRSEVHVIHRNERVLDAEEPDAGDALAEALREDGVALHLRARTKAVRRDGERIVVSLEDGSELALDALLVATGRRPNAAALNCERGGVALNARGSSRSIAPYGRRRPGFSRWATSPANPRSRTSRGKITGAFFPRSAAKSANATTAS
jgi:pyruvate/2-oxoglutarate dehydrogenase complex dihydrolipoamide dehydrogenase (E3) component